MTSAATKLPGVRPARGFTLAELIVVIAIIALLAAIGLPAFSSAVSSSEKSLAENQLVTGLGAGRDAAIRSGVDAAAVFAFAPGGQMSIIPCVKAGTLRHPKLVSLANSTNPRDWEDRDVFVPLTATRPTQLPKHWMVRGYAPAWSVSRGGNQDNGWYESAPVGVDARALNPDVGNWVFPETGFYDLTAGQPWAQGNNRQTFMVRFKGGTGEVDAANTALAMAVLPVPSEVATSGSATSWRASAPPVFVNNRIDTASDLAKFVRKVLTHPTLGVNANLIDATRVALLGDASVDTVVARPVADVALYNEKTLASGLRLRGLNPATGTVYGDSNDRQRVPGSPQIDSSLRTANSPAAGVEFSDAINAWIEGRYRPRGATGPVESDAKLYTLDRYLGRNREVKR